MSADRAWAAAMAMNSTQSTENTQKKMAASTRRQIISRLNRATQYAKGLVSCLRDEAISGATNRDILEAAAYLASLCGGLHFQKARWDLCVQEYSVARVIYTTLGSGPRTDLFKDQLSSTIDPSIRYAAYRLRLSRTKAVSDIAIERFPPDEGELRSKIEIVDPDAFVSSAEAEARGKTALEDVPSAISWRYRTVKIEDATIAQAIAVANKKERELSENHAKADVPSRELAAAYDDVINARQEAVDTTKSVLDELTAEGVDPSDSRIQSLQLTRTAVTYAVIELRIGRNRVLCGAYDDMFSDHVHLKPSHRRGKITTSPTVRHQSIGTKLGRLRQRVALYDSILQSIGLVEELSGVAGDEGFMEELSGKRAYFRALKYAPFLC